MHVVKKISDWFISQLNDVKILQTGKRGNHSTQDLAELVQYAKAYKKKKPSRDQSPDQSPGPSSSV